MPQFINKVGILEESMLYFSLFLSDNREVADEKEQVIYLKVFHCSCGSHCLLPVLSTCVSCPLGWAVQIRYHLCPLALFSPHPAHSVGPTFQLPSSWYPSASLMLLVISIWRVEHWTPGECDTTPAKGTQVRLGQDLPLSGQKLETASHSYCLTCFIFCRSGSMWSFEISIGLHIVFHADLLNFRALFACGS